MNLSKVVLIGLLLALVYGLVAGSLVSIWHKDIGLFVGFFVWGMAFSTLLSKFVCFKIVLKEDK